LAGPADQTSITDPARFVPAFYIASLPFQDTPPRRIFARTVTVERRRSRDYLVPLQVTFALMLEARHEACFMDADAPLLHQVHPAKKATGHGL
jgi:hypothetical protein